MTKRFVSGTGFFQPMAGCSVCTKTIEQMLIAGTALETCHGKRALAGPLALPGFELRKSDGGQPRRQVKGALGR